MEAATSGNPKFFLGQTRLCTPWAPRRAPAGALGSSVACALELYAETFDSQGKLHLLENFASVNGKAFYGNVPPVSPSRKVKLVRQEWTVPLEFDFGGQKVRPLRAGEEILWKIVRENK